LPRGRAGPGSPDEVAGSGFGFNSNGGGSAPVDWGRPGQRGGKVVLVACTKRKREERGSVGAVAGHFNGA
jgi:hypothetical protein